MDGLNQAADLEKVMPAERLTSVSPGNGEGHEKTAPEPPGTILEPREKEILDRQSQFQDTKATFFGFYRYATLVDLALVAVSTFAAIIAGALHPTAPVG